jgi:prepilin-type N-terminal cleavage/methylation domain-containing protein
MRHAFTLIELLVVVTILVVLLALLTPALDKAIYEAELAVCAANQQALAGSAIQYTLGNRRSYATRGGIAPGKVARPSQLRVIRLPQESFDDRPLLRTFIDINRMMGCPFDKPVNLETGDPDSWLYASRQFWFGWQYRGQKGMFKLGDRFGSVSPVDNVQREFAVLVSDWISQDSNLAADAAWNYGAHPDYKDGILAPAVHQDAGDAASNAGSPASHGAAGKLTLSFWVNMSRPRGPIDRNIAFDDGSVRQYRSVRWNDYRTMTQGMVPVRERSDSSVDYLTYLPLR